MEDGGDGKITMSENRKGENQNMKRMQMTGKRMAMLLAMAVWAGLWEGPAQGANVSQTVKSVTTLAKLAAYDPYESGAATTLLVTDSSANGIWIYNPNSAVATNTYSVVSPTARKGRYLRLEGPALQTGSFGALTATNAVLIGGDYATLGSDQITNGTFATDSGWTKSAAAWSIHDGKAYMVADGSARTLSQPVAGMARFKLYQITFDLAVSAGSLTVTLGGVTYAQTYSATGASTRLYVMAADTTDLYFTGATDFTGTIDNVVLKEITGSKPTFSIRNTSGSLTNQMRTYSTSVAVGGHSAEFAIWNASGNSTLGFLSGYGLTTGSGNSINGKEAGFNLGKGAYNVLNGYQAGYSLIGDVNVLSGRDAGGSLTYAHSNVFMGHLAGYNALQLATAVGSIGIGPGAYTTKNYQLVLGGPNITETQTQGHVVPMTNAVDNLGSGSKYFLASYIGTLNASNITFQMLGPVVWKTNNLINVLTNGAGAVTSITTNIIMYLGR